MTTTRTTGSGGFSLCRCCFCWSSYRHWRLTWSICLSPSSRQRIEHRRAAWSPRGAERAGNGLPTMAHVASSCPSVPTTLDIEGFSVS